MLRRLNESIHLQVDAKRIVGRRMRGFFGVREINSVSRNLESGSSSVSWGEHVRRVLTELDSMQSIEGLHLSVTLANSQLHFDVVRGHFAPMSTRQLNAISKAHVEDMLLDILGPQVVQWALQGDEQHIFIAALSQSVLDEYSMLAIDLGLRLTQVTASFIQSWNQHRSRLRKEPCLLAVVEKRHVVLVYVENGSIVALSQFTLSEENCGNQLDHRASRLMAGLGLTYTEICGFYFCGDLLNLPDKWGCLQISQDGAHEESAINN